MRHIVLPLATVLLASCTGGGLFERGAADRAVEVRRPDTATARPKSRPATRQVGEPGGLNSGGVPVTAAARATAEQVAAATRPVERPEQDLGTTVATLGLLEREGFWLSTPLVRQAVPGRVVYEATGAAANVMLVPNGAAAGSGSQISIAAMQVMGIPITELARLRVFVR